MQSQSTKNGSESVSALIRVPQVAQEMAVSVRSVWRLISEGELKVVRIGKSVRVKRDSMQAFCDKGGAR